MPDCVDANLAVVERLRHGDANFIGVTFHVVEELFDTRVVTAADDVISECVICRHLHHGAVWVVAVIAQIGMRPRNRIVRGWYAEFWCRSAALTK